MGVSSVAGSVANAAELERGSPAWASMMRSLPLTFTASTMGLPTSSHRTGITAVIAGEAASGGASGAVALSTTMVSATPASGSAPMSLGCAASERARSGGRESCPQPPATRPATTHLSSHPRFITPKLWVRSGRLHLPGRCVYATGKFGHTVEEFVSQGYTSNFFEFRNDDTVTAQIDLGRGRRTATNEPYSFMYKPTAEGRANCTVLFYASVYEHFALGTYAGGNLQLYGTAADGTILLEWTWAKR